MDTNWNFNANANSSPLDFGLNIAWAHRKFFLQLGAVLVLADMIVYKVASDEKFFTPEQLLTLVPMINLMLVAFVLSAAGVLAVTVARKEAADFKQVMIAALSYFPKILISVMFIFPIMYWGATFIPIILIFLMWSPFCAIADFYEQGTEKPDNKIRVKALKSEPDNYSPLDVLIGSDDDDDDPGKEPGFFDNSIVNIGLIRSATLSGQHFSAATYVALVILLVLSLNALLLLGSQLASGNEALNFLTRIIASLSISFLAAVTAGSFIAILPESARKELKIKKLSEVIDSEPRIKTDTKFLSTVIFLLVASMAGSYYLFKDLKQMPSNVEITVASAYVESTDAVIKLNIVDDKRNFIWFAPEAFSISWGSGGVATLSKPTGSSVTDAAGLPLYAIPRNITQITLSIRIPYAQDARSFELYYNNIFDVGGKKVFITKGSIKP